MTKLYAICDRAAYDKFKDYFCPQHGSHYIELQSGKLLVIAFFHKEENEIVFANLPGVTPLPDAFFTSGTLAKEHAEQLAELGITESSSMLDVARAAGARHPLMKLRSWL